ncbi:hypothetical protein Tco_1408546 [Tanacetum coccineum]
MDESGASDKDGEDDQVTRSKFERLLQQEKQTENPNITNSINTLNIYLKGENLSNRCSSNALEASTVLTRDDGSSSVQDGPIVLTILILLVLLGFSVCFSC